MERYTGVLYQELGLADAPPPPVGAATRRCAPCRGCGASSPRGPDPAVPAQDVRLARWARPPLDVVAAAPGTASLAELTRGSRGVGPAPQRARGGHRLGRWGRRPRRVTVRFLDAEGRTVSHWNKLLKGSLVRWLLTEQPAGPEALGAFRHPLGYRFDPGASSLDGRRRRRRPPRRPVGSRRVSAKPHFSIARIPVRVEPVFLVISGLWGLRYLDTASTSSSSGSRAASCRSSSTSWATASRSKAFGQPSVIVLHGFGGVTISQRRRSLSRARSIIVSLAGSLTAMLLLWLPARTWLDSDAGVAAADRLLPSAAS